MSAKTLLSGKVVRELKYENQNKNCDRRQYIQVIFNEAQWRIQEFFFFEGTDQLHITSKKKKYNYKVMFKKLYLKL